MMVNNVNDTIEFYKRKLGFTCVLTVPDTGTFDFAILSKGDVAIMVQERKSLSSEVTKFEGQPMGGTFTLYIDVDSIEPIYETLSKNVTIVQDLHTTFYGTEEFSIEDCNGYVLVFSSRNS